MNASEKVLRRQVVIPIRVRIPLLLRVRLWLGAKLVMLGLRIIPRTVRPHVTVTH